MNRNARNAELINHLIRQRGLPRNQVAALSGLSNAYIRELEKGNLTNVGRNKLIALGVALSLDLSTVDRLLNAFDRTPLTEEDITTFLSVAEKGQLSTSLIPLRDFYTMELLLGSLEKVPGRHVLISTRPTETFKDAGHRRYNERFVVEQHPVYEKLMEKIFDRRLRAVTNNLLHHRFDQYVCIRCLNDYLAFCTDPVERDWRIQHIRNTIEKLEKFQNCNLYLTESCPSFFVVLKQPKQPANTPEQVAIVNIPSHFWEASRSGLISGFMTLKKSLLDVFKLEVKTVENKVIDKYVERPKLINFLNDLIEKFQVGKDHE